MKTKRSYGTVDVEKFDAKTVLPLLTTGCIVAVDVAKTKFVAAIATPAGDVVKLVKFEHPRQTGTLSGGTVGSERRRPEAGRGDGSRRGPTVMRFAISAIGGA